MVSPSAFAVLRLTTSHPFLAPVPEGQQASQSAVDVVRPAAKMFDNVVEHVFMRTNKPKS
jgi:hypothetical protein